MSILRYVPTNLIADRTASQITAPTTATGYLSTDLTAGGPAQFWVSSAASNSHAIDVDLGSTGTVSFAAAFDVRATDGVSSVTSVTVERSASWPWVTSGGATSLSAHDDSTRRDYATTINSGTARSVRFWINLSGISAIRVGELWVGSWATTTRAAATVRQSMNYREIRNVSDAGSIRVAQIADYGRTIDLGFDRLEDYQREELESVLHTLRGGRNAIVLLPNGVGEPTKFYHGRLGPSLSWDQDYPVNTGLAWTFTESGRRLA